MSDIITDIEIIENTLEPSWFVKQPMDYESKMYTMLAFLKTLSINMDNGFMFPDFITLEQRYKDIESFLESFEIVYANKEDEELFRYVYDLPSSSHELREIDKIVNQALKVLGDTYYEAKNHIQFIVGSVKVFNKITDRRSSVTYFVENCETNVIEKYIVGKTNVTYIGSFYSSDSSYLYDESNYIQVVSDICTSTEHTIIPIVKKLIESGDYF